MYQVDVLGPARDRFDDEEAPMTKDEFEEHKKRIEENMPEVVSKELNVSSQPMKPEVLDVISKPTL